MRESQHWEECFQRASYYLWSALRGQIIAGNDPLTGTPRAERAFLAPQFRDESRAAYKALARFWLERLRTSRERGRR
jgi:hypothetical protein